MNAGGIFDPVSVGNSNGLERKSPYCNDYDCPSFTLICKVKEFEVRRYESSTWAYSEAEALSKITAITTAFNKNYRYISGNNEENLTIPMSLPVLVRERLPYNNWFAKKSYRVLLYLPKHAPTPSNHEVKIAKLESKTFYVYYYVGSLWSWYYNHNNFEVLNAFLQENGIDQPSEYYVAGYDNQSKLLNRPNEIWVEAPKSHEISKICSQD
ncbi:heme-binding protein 2-like [Gordionus sp. m RMFG-2023]|uniref:heme-binding protein 2-like n=1 Tax=Gordionus sp. m RMFG-2023 TaxID=3053472 RepID=UPI0031FCC9A3